MSYSGWASFVQRADVWKYFVLYWFGGVYGDLDVDAVRPYSDWRGHPLVLSQEPYAHSRVLNGISRTVCNAFMSSVPRHPFWLHVLAEVKQRAYMTDPVDSTGPRMLEHVMKEYKRKQSVHHAALTQKGLPIRENTAFPDVTIAPPESFMPFFDQPPVRSKCEGDILPNSQVLASLKEKNSKVGQNHNLTIPEKSYLLCLKLQKRNYTNLVHPRSYTVHRWSHTWLGAVKDKQHVGVEQLLEQHGFEFVYDLALTTDIDPRVRSRGHTAASAGKLQTQHQKRERTASSSSSSKAVSAAEDKGFARRRLLFRRVRRQRRRAQRQHTRKQKLKQKLKVKLGLSEQKRKKNNDRRSRGKGAQFSGVNKASKSNNFQTSKTKVGQSPWNSGSQPTTAKPQLTHAPTYTPAQRNGFARPIAAFDAGPRLRGGPPGAARQAQLAVEAKVRQLQRAKDQKLLRGH